MGKIVTEQMSRETLNMTELRAQVRSLELCPWYKGPKNSVKLASSGTRSLEEHQEDGVQSVKGIHTTRYLAGVPVQIAAKEVTAQRNVATSPAVQPKKPKKHKKLQTRRPRKRRKMQPRRPKKLPKKEKEKKKR